MSLPRLVILPDLVEENWPSMDLCCDMLAEHLRDRTDLVAEMRRPKYERRFTALPVLHRHRTARNADRLFNRLRTYPRFVRSIAGDYDFFHIVDHSYAHVIHDLPAGQTGVLCHDLDTFRCILHPELESRPRWFCAMSRRILHGLSKAVVIFYTTDFVRGEILQHGIADEQKLVKVPLGVAPEFGHVQTPPEPFILHVGSCIRRKRIDILLDVVAGVRKRRPEVRLIQAGGQFSSEHQGQIQRLGITDAVEQRRGLTRAQLADLYRKASLVLLTSEAEGFGLPVIEALGCGAIVVASDIPAFREVAGNAAEFVALNDVPSWIDRVQRLLTDRSAAPPLPTRLARAQQYSWANHADIIAQTYLHLGARR